MIRAGTGARAKLRIRAWLVAVAVITTSFRSRSGLRPTLMITISSGTLSELTALLAEFLDHFADVFATLTSLFEFLDDVWIHSLTEVAILVGATGGTVTLLATLRALAAAMMPEAFTAISTGTRAFARKAVVFESDLHILWLCFTEDAEGDLLSFFLLPDQSFQLLVIDQQLITDLHQDIILFETCFGSRTAWCNLINGKSHAFTKTELSAHLGMDGARAHTDPGFN